MALQLLSDAEGLLSQLYPELRLAVRQLKIFVSLLGIVIWAHFVHPEMDLFAYSIGMYIFTSKGDRKQQAGRQHPEKSHTGLCDFSF